MRGSTPSPTRACSSASSDQRARRRSGTKFWPERPKESVMTMRIDRRTFLHSTLATTAALAAGGAAAAETKPKLKKAVKYGMIQIKGPIEEKLELVKSLGFQGVEMDSPSKIDKDEAVKARDKTGIVIHGVIDSVHWKDTL